MVSKRTELNDSFIADLAADWEQHGASTIEKLRQSRPELYARLAADLVPRKVEVSDSGNNFENMTGEEIEEWLINEYASKPEVWARFKIRVQSLIDSGASVVQIELDSPAPSSTPTRSRGRRPGVPFVQGQ